LAEGLNLTLEAGDFTCLLGPNGAGKSTLMRTLAGMQAPLAGRICLGGDDLVKLSPLQVAQRLSLVLTTRLQPSLLTGYDVVALGRHPHTGWTGRLTRRDTQAIMWALEAVDGVELASRRLVELSDGERQKMLIARALAQETPLIFLDEPTAFLDLPHRIEIMKLLGRLARELGKTILLSTHDLDLALRMAECLWLLNPQGEMRVGSPEDLVLDGAFEQTFRGAGLRFDNPHSLFDLSHRLTGVIQVVGQGLAHVWTQRALERAGYAIAPQAEGALARVEIMEGGVWRLHSPQASTQHLSLADLLHHVQSLTSQGERPHERP
jgi:iron complex transport system ATP-binding protein